MTKAYLRAVMQERVEIYSLLLEAAKWDDDVGEWARRKIQDDALWLAHYVDRMSNEETPAGWEFQDAKRRLRKIVRPENKSRKRDRDR